VAARPLSCSLSHAERAAVVARARSRNLPVSRLIRRAIIAYLAGDTAPGSRHCPSDGIVEDIILPPAAASSLPSELGYELPRKLPNQPMSLAERIDCGGFNSGTRANAGTVSPRRQGMSDRPQRQGMRDR
jgi:hypothetical protein